MFAIDEEEEEETSSMVSHAHTEDERLGPSLEEIDAAVREVSHSDVHLCTKPTLSYQQKMHQYASHVKPVLQLMGMLVTAQASQALSVLGLVPGWQTQLSEAFACSIQCAGVWLPAFTLASCKPAICAMRTC